MRYFTLAAMGLLSACAPPQPQRLTFTHVEPEPIAPFAQKGANACAAPGLIRSPAVPVTQALLIVPDGFCPTGMLSLSGLQWRGDLRTAAQARSISEAEALSQVEAAMRAGNPQVGSLGQSAASHPRAEAIPKRVQRPQRQVLQYEEAVADQTRDPEAARFRRTFVVRHPLESHDALCGEMNAKNAYGGYVGYQIFYAPVVQVGSRYSAVLWTSEKFGADKIADLCGLSGKSVSP